MGEADEMRGERGPSYSELFFPRPPPQPHGAPREVTPAEAPISTERQATAPTPPLLAQEAMRAQGAVPWVPGWGKEISRVYPLPFPINRSEKPGPEGLGQEMGCLAVAMTDGEKEGPCRDRHGWGQTWRPGADADGRQGGLRRADPEDTQNP